MKQEDWTKQLRDRLADHQEAVPEDLWAGIEAGLSDPVPQHRHGTSWRRWVAAAAFALLLAGGTMILWNRGESAEFRGESAEFRGERREERGERIAETLNLAQNHTKGQTLRVNSLQTTESQIIEAEETQISEPETIEPTELPQTIETPETIPTERPQTMPSETPQTMPTETPQTMPSETEKAEVPTIPTEKSVAQTLPQPLTPFAVVKEKRHDSRQLLAALYVGNGQYNQEDIARVQMSPNEARKYNSMNAVSATRSDEIIWLADYEEREHHERPIIFGFQLCYPLTERLSLTSGLVYIRLNSEFAKLMKGTEVEQQQQLHYVGLPLGLQYRLLQLGHLNVYAAAGTQADWNVSARMSVNGSQFDIDHDRLQWSLNGALGLSYDLTPHVALFAEPGIKHYFENGSSVQNYFKDKPTNLSLRVGVQLNVGKR